MGVTIDNGGVMHDVAGPSGNVTEASAARAVDLLASIDVNTGDAVDRSGYTTSPVTMHTPPATMHAPARIRAMQTSYSDVSDDADDTSALSHDTIDKPNLPLMTPAMLQRTNLLLKRVHTEHPDPVCNI
jgi:hypothetical protein